MRTLVSVATLLCLVVAFAALLAFDRGGRAAPDVAAALVTPCTHQPGALLPDVQAVTPDVPTMARGGYRYHRELVQGRDALPQPTAVPSTGPRSERLLAGRIGHIGHIGRIGCARGRYDTRWGSIAPRSGPLGV